MKKPNIAANRIDPTDPYFIIAVINTPVLVKRNPIVIIIINANTIVIYLNGSMPK